VRACCEGLLDHAGQDRLIQTAWGIQEAADAGALADVIQPPRDLGAGS